ncbi:hypothetical protein J6590_102512 [Homalodisca vitripennis]|nr:hypothetical protein J6590_003028 [Homalodisca vitripennis]KAG8333826.1 hypothetical protein J6590_102512 [Homalodisca vitripennis]
MGRRMPKPQNLVGGKEKLDLKVVVDSRFELNIYETFDPQFILARMQFNLNFHMSVSSQGTFDSLLIMYRSVHTWPDHKLVSLDCFLGQACGRQVGLRMENRLALTIGYLHTFTRLRDFHPARPEP